MTGEIVDAVSAGMDLSKEDRRRLSVNVSDRLKEMRRDGRVVATKLANRINEWRLRTDRNA
jgi:hypothetical protein